MDFKKRSSKQINTSVSDGDFTGGYEFLPWVWYMRKGLFFSILLNVFIGYQCLKYYLEHKELAGLLSGGFFVLIIPTIISYLLFREHKEKKRGILR